MATIRPPYSTWPLYNSRFRDAVRGMTEEQLAIQPTPERWPLWASVGHMACQRVFWLSVTSPANPAPRRRRSRTPDTTVPGTTTLEHVLSGEALAEALD
ncbi:MAG TPA: DinB family protein [Actinomycetota bacterium]|nr:DinB family protein [Actinomycetota bacterium]